MDSLALPARALRGLQLDAALTARVLEGFIRDEIGKFGFTRGPVGFALGHAARARLVDGNSVEARLFEGGVLRFGKKLFEHRFFDRGGIIPTFQNVGASEVAQCVLLRGIGRGAYMACCGAIRNTARTGFAGLSLLAQAALG